jgi:hypothetical protein
MHAKDHALSGPGFKNAHLITIGGKWHYLNPDATMGEVMMHPAAPLVTAGRRLSREQPQTASGSQQAYRT